MGSNGEKVQDIQRQIFQIVEEVPQLFKRLHIFMATTAIHGLVLRQDPPLPFLRELLLNNPCQISPPILFGVVSNRMVENKEEELCILKDEVATLFSRIANVLNWGTIVDICRGTGGIVVLPETQQHPLSILDIYEKQFEI